MKYVAFYDTEDYKEENRSVALCAANVVDYMISVISEYGELDIISPSRTRNKSGVFHGRKNKIRDSVTLVQPPSFGTSNLVSKAILVGYTRLWFLYYMFKNTKKGETVIAYHSVSTMNTLRIIKKLRKINLILEVRELYSDARENYDEFKNDQTKLRKKELSFFEIADKYIFPTELLNEIINKENKPHVTVPGPYVVEKRLAPHGWGDGKTHIVYAGTIRGAKGVLTSVDVAEELPSNYAIHILGKGTEASIRTLEERIEKVNQLGHAQVTYEGQLRGDDYKAFLQKCDIGLVPQDPGATFTNTSFPSKILSYLSNGLYVVSVRIPAVDESPLKEKIIFYDNNDMKSIAKSIIEAASNTSNNTTEELLNRLDKNFRDEMEKLLQNHI